MPQLDGEVGDEEGAGDATIHELDEQADLSTNAEESNMEADDLAKSMEGVKIQVKPSDCLEAFQDPSIGGIALALPHGSVVIECAKAELHATTALSQPNREEPHRIGLVFYQHKNLHHPNHGVGEFQRKRAIREFRDYVQWLKGNYVPTEAKLKAMIESGFVFPNEVKTVNKPMDVANPDDYFRSDSFQDPAAAKKVQDSMDSIDFEAGHKLETFYTNSLAKGPVIEDEIHNTPQLPEVELTEKDMEEVRYYEEMLRKEFGPK